MRGAPTRLERSVFGFYIRFNRRSGGAFTLITLKFTNRRNLRLFPKRLALPPLLLHSSRHAASAPALCCACLVQPEHLAKQWNLIKSQGQAGLLQDVDKLYDEVSKLAPRQKLQLNGKGRRKPPFFFASSHALGAWRHPDLAHC